MTHVGFVFEKRASHMILAASSTNTHAFRFRIKPFLIELEPLQRWAIIPSQDGTRRCSQHLRNDTNIAYPIQELPFTLAQQATLSRAVLTGCLGILVLYGRRDIQSSGRILPWKVSLHGFGVDRSLFANVCDIWRCWDDTPKSLGTSQYWHQRQYQGPLFCEVCSFAQAGSRSCQTTGCLTPRGCAQLAPSQGHLLRFQHIPLRRLLLAELYLPYPVARLKYRLSDLSCRTDQFGFLLQGLLAFQILSIQLIHRIVQWFFRIHSIPYCPGHL